MKPRSALRLEGLPVRGAHQRYQPARALGELRPRELTKHRCKHVKGAKTESPIGYEKGCCCSTLPANQAARILAGRR